MKRGRSSRGVGKAKSPVHRKARFGVSGRLIGKSTAGRRIAKPGAATQTKAAGYRVDSAFDTATGLAALSDRAYGIGHADQGQPTRAGDIGGVFMVQGPLVQMETSALKTLHGFSDEEIYGLVVPKRTLARRNAEKQPLSVEETDRAIRLARIGKIAERVFGNAEKAHRWLRKSKPSLDGGTPLAYLATETGARVVEEMLARIDHGILP